MGKYSVIIYITVAIVLLLLVSRSSNNHRRRHRRLKIRSNFTFTTPPADHHRSHDRAAFDPLVAEIERKREDREWEQHYFQSHHPELDADSTHSDSAPGHESPPEWEDFMDAEDYLNDEEKFNVTDRLVLLFPKIDVDPADGYLSEDELTQWNLQQSHREMMHRTQRQMEVHDKNKDVLISFAEYDPPSWAKNSDNESFGYEMGWWKFDHFNASDADGDGLLNVTEFNDFLHPADTNSPKLLHWLCKEEIRSNGDDVEGIMDASDEEKSYRLRLYVLSLDSETLQRYATIRSKEAVSLIERQTQALFGQPDIKVSEDGSLDASNDEVASITLSGLTMLVLEAVSFGSFLWDMENFVESKYPFINS